MSRLDRRRFLARLGMLAAAGAALEALPGWARQALAASITSHEKSAGAAAAPADLIERNDWPEHWETSLSALGRDFQTANDAFFVRSHFGAPDIDLASWRLEVSGSVETPLSLTLADLRGMPLERAMVTLECAGNGRGLYALPSTSGTQWGYGAVGNARWSGVALAEVLRRAGVRADARHVWFECADHATLDGVPSFTRSIPLEKAMDDVLLAHYMNGNALPTLHGAPLRAIVPGWYGMASAKWLTRIRVEPTPSDNHFMVKGYRYTYPGEDPLTAAPVETLRVKSLITRPLDGARLSRGGVVVEGVAWADSSLVQRVELSIDDGATWREAEPTSVRYPAAWMTWDAQLQIASPRRLTLLARATDGNGVVQPLAARPNAGGYGNNSVHRVTVDVV